MATAKRGGTRSRTEPLETPSRGGNFLGELDRFIRRDVCRRYRLATATMMSAASCARVVGSSKKTRAHSVEASMLFGEFSLPRCRKIPP